MEEMGVTNEDIEKRLSGLVKSKSGLLSGLIILPSSDQSIDRAALVKDLHGVLQYCQVDIKECHLAGSPVLITELDRLGSQAAIKPLFTMCMAICGAFLFYYLRAWKPALAILGVTVWAIYATLSLVYLAGGEMNFILTVLPIMVMVFTLATSIHFLHYFATEDEKYSAEGGDDLRITNALLQAWKPCFFAALTTAIGLISLGMSDFAPVRSFGYGAACGCGLAMLAGLFLTPAVITLFPIRNLHAQKSASNTNYFWGDWIILHRRKILYLTGILVVGTGIGVLWTRVYIEPIDFLPTKNKIYADYQSINQHLTCTDSLEAVIDFDGQDIPFVEKLNRIQSLHNKFDAHADIHNTMSLASFFPTEFPSSPRSLAKLLKKAQRHSETNGFLAEGERLWRISMRIAVTNSEQQQQIIQELKIIAGEEAIHFTGIAPLLKHAQYQIFDGFWKSFATAFLIITCVMAVALKSIRFALVAMIPNLTPILIVFGILGWLNIPIDIGMMMTGSIALGIAVDGTFHYLVLYSQFMKKGQSKELSARNALKQAGAPITQAAVLCGVGMLALTMSHFGPTARFGYLMATLLVVALLGDLVILPALMATGKSNEVEQDEEQSEGEMTDSSSDSAIIVPLPFPSQPKTTSKDDDDRPQTAVG